MGDISAIYSNRLSDLLSHNQLDAFYAPVSFKIITLFLSLPVNSSCPKVSNRICSYDTAAITNAIVFSFFHMPHLNWIPMELWILASFFANITISDLNRISIPQRKTRRSSRSTRNSKYFVLFIKPTLLSLYLVSFNLRALC